MRELIACLTLAAALGAPTMVRCQRPVESPDAVARRVLKAVDAGDWRMLLALTHPAALFNYREDQVRTLGFQWSTEFPAPDSCMIQMIRNENRRMLDSVFQVPSLDSLARTRPETVFVRMARYLTRLPPLPDTLRNRREIIGAVAANDSTAYVVIEHHYPWRAFPAAPASRPAIMTFRAFNGTWRSMLDPDLEPGASTMFMGDGCTNDQ